MKREITEPKEEPVSTGRKDSVLDSSPRHYPIGAELIGPNETHFRVWAPKAKRIDVVLEKSAAKDIPRTFHSLTPEDAGYFSGSVVVGAGGCYRFRVDNSEHFYPDPA